MKGQQPPITAIGSELKTEEEMPQHQQNAQ